MKECYKPKTSDEIQKASEEYLFRTHIDNTSVQDHFIAGAEWMKESSFDGKALLYAVAKTEERTKKEMIKKAKKYLQEKLYTTPIFEYDEDEEPIMYVCASCCDSVEEFISDFKQAMEE